MALRPVRLEPLFVSRIWGARTLAPLFPEKQSLPEPIGEVWLTGSDCRLADGPFAGERLGDAWPRMDEAWTGKLASQHHEQFPILAKFLFPEDKLSVQVHPDDDYASRHEALAGGVGKTEMWYVVSARPGAEVRVGLRAEVNREAFRNAIAHNTVEELVDRIPVQAGDTIFVPAGTVHSIGPGMVLCEVQQNSDITYRVFDYDRLDAQVRPRELHVEKALQVIRFGKQCGGRVSAAAANSEIGQTTSTLVECPYFTAQRHAFKRATSLPSEGKLHVLIILEGKGTLCARDNLSAEYLRAQTWLVPAALHEITFAPEEPTTVLHVTAPSL